MTGKLDGKVALVSGVSGGIGGVLLLASIEETSPDAYRDVHKVNVEGAFLGLRRATWPLQRCTSRRTTRGG